ncbi:MFS transporter [Paractinoplanes lichenicola]|uniref:MFS transporter n=1 Tax=Paractinoplanes lichenicola TaxID=2802976 RepID=A0ABS1W2V4_9ACTN|nr:MFS transporter [Actinoplanes lichenicola]MBL7261060.1 MFS transporter [Actinoplanes lichenicola]
MTGLATVFVRWTWWRALLHRGWWAVTSVYLVTVAHLTASELVLIGVGQSLAALVLEIPAGVLADTVSRKWSLVVSQVLMGASMLATALVDGFWPLLVTQMAWGLAWNFAGGADVAWISDELDDPPGVAVVLVRAEQAQLTGTVAGLVAVSGLAWLIGPGPAMVSAGVAMLLLGLYVVARFPERRFRPVAAHRWRAARSILRRGSSLVRGSRLVLGIFAATFLVNGVTGAFGRLYPLRLVDLGLAVDPVLWLGALGVLMSLAGAAALHVVRPHINGPTVLRRGFVATCVIAALGAAGLAVTPEELSGSLAVVLAAGSLPLTRAFTTIWVNQQAGSAVRATVHSLAAQAKYLGEITCGLAIAAVAAHATTPTALLTCGVLLAAAALLIQRVASAGPPTTGDRLQ